MEKTKELINTLSNSFIGQWLYAGGYGLPIAMLSMVMYWVPAILLLGYFGYSVEQEAVEYPLLCLWAGAACGIYVGLSEGKRIAKAEIQNALEPWQQLELKRYLEASSRRKLREKS